MFLVAVTRNRSAAALPDLKREDFELGDLRIAVLRDEQRIDFSPTSTGFDLSEEPFGRPDPADAFMRMTLDRPGRSLEVRTSGASSSSVYYAFGPDGAFHCASHVRLLRAAGVEIAEDESLLPEFFRYRQILAPFTLFKGIKQLVRSELRITLEGDRCRLVHEKLHDPLPPAGSGSDDVEALAGGALAIFQSLLGLHAGRGERVAVPLSGGMDSSVLFRVAQRGLDLRESFSAGYPFESDAHNREREYAVSAAQSFGSEHTYYQPTTPQYLAGVIRAIDAAEEPIHHMQTAVIEGFFREGLPERTQVIVSGVGAGAAFGTPLHRLAFDYRRNPFYRLLSVPPIRQSLRLASSTTDRGRRLVKLSGLAGRLDDSATSENSVAWSMDSYGSVPWIKQYFGVGHESTTTSRASLLSGFAERSLLDKLSLIDMFDKTCLIWGKIAARTGKVMHYPFMEEQLQRFILAAPWPVQLRSNKHVLAAIGRKLGIPDAILDRPKSGFGVRRKDWARRGGVLEPLVPLAAKAFDVGEIRRMQSDQEEQAMTFWNMLNYGIWKRLHVWNEPADALLEELRDAAKDRAGSPGRAATAVR